VGPDGRDGFGVADGFGGFDDSDDSDGAPPRRPVYEDDADSGVAPGHSEYLHRDDERRRDEAGGRYPRAAMFAGVAAVAVVAGWALIGSLGGGKPDPGGQAAPGAVTSPAGTGTETQGSEAADIPSSSAAATPTTPAKPTTSKKPSPSKTPATTPSTPRSSASTSASPAFTSLKPGSTGSAVSTMQHRLQQDGYLLEMLGYSDGTFDGPTSNGVAAFQDNHPGTAKADGRGVYGPATDAALRRDLGQQ
jgi:hypothetical protein